MKQFLHSKKTGTTKVAAIFMAFFGLAFSQQSWGQISMTSTGSNTQNFNTLTTSSTITWTDNSTVSNWYSQRTGNISTIIPDAGAGTAGALYSYGTGVNTERALGTIGSGNAAAGSFAHGVLLRNTSGALITDIKVTYTLEEWRKGGAVIAQAITFWYKTSSSPISNLNPNDPTGWIQVTGLTLNSPVNTTGGTSLDGNNALNKVTASNVSLTSLSLASNDYIMLKWEDPDHSGTDHGLAIDDVTVAWTTCTPPTIDNSSTTDNICVGGLTGAVDITASGDIASYAWTGPDFSAATEDISGLAAGDYNVVITATGGCTTSQDYTVADGTGTAPVQPGTPVFNPTQKNLCSEANITLTVPVDANATSYNWVLPPNFTGSSTTNSIVVSPTATFGQVKFEAYAINSCGTSPVRYVNIWGTPSKPVVSAPACINLNDIVTFTVTNAEAGVTYNWIYPVFAQLISSTSNSITIKWTKSFNRSVFVTGNNACGNSGRTLYAVTLGNCAKSAKYVVNQKLPAYPNPTPGLTNIMFTASKETKCTITVSDITGKQLFRNERVAAAGLNKVNIDLGKFAKGVYQVSVITNDGIETIKIVKE